MEDEKIVKCIVELERIFFPKRRSSIKNGEYGIFLANIIEPLDNCENIFKTIKLKGTGCEINYGEKYKVTCKLADVNEQYGDTYEIVYDNRLVDLKDKVKQHNFLMSILNETTVNRLFETYEDVVSLLENEDVKSLVKVKGIGVPTAMRIIDKYKDCKDYSSIYTELGHLGLSNNLIKRLVDFYKSPDVAIDTIKTNPYDLVRVDGIGFKKADEIAEKVGISGSNPNRVKGCLIYILSQGGENGRSYLHYADLLKQLNDSIGYVEQDIINKVAQSLIAKKEVYVSDNGEYIGLHKYRKLEEDIALELIRILNADSKIEIADIENIIKETEKAQEYDFTEEQREAIITFAKENLLALTGGAGTGKSTTIKGMVDLVSDYSCIGCSLSGKASVRIKEATGMEAMTIHRLLGYQHGQFMFNSETPLPYDVYIMDEATMTSGELFLSFLKAIPNGSKLVLAGDVQQLTPIGSCQVFADVLNCGVVPTVRLTKPHRQALKSGIIPLSMSIINQQPVCDSTFQGKQILGELQDMELDVFKDDLLPSSRVVNHFLTQYNIEPNLMEIQIAVPMKNRGDMCTYNLNLLIQSKINPINENRKNIIVSLDKERFYTIQTGDKVINTKNNYNAKTLEGDDVAVFNGNMGIVKDIKDGFITIDFDGIGEVVLDGASSKSLELGYACTIHKLQGSQFHRLIFAINSSDFVLLNAELGYTGITRASKYCVFVFKNQAMKTMVNKREVKNKQTYLSMILQEKLLKAS
jgi:exodeoxyribonuclease V alpha subunit